MFQFNSKYFIAFLLLFLVEAGIALFVQDQFIRPYLGDVLVVLLLYCFVRTFLKTKPIYAVAGVLAFSFLIEILQYFRLVELLGLQENRMARTVLGSSFDWRDMAAYLVGAAVILVIERKDRSRPVPTKSEGK